MGGGVLYILLAEKQYVTGQFYAMILYVNKKFYFFMWREYSVGNILKYEWLVIIGEKKGVDGKAYIFFSFLLYMNLYCLIYMFTVVKNKNIYIRRT